MEGAPGTIKNPRPFLNYIEGTRVVNRRIYACCGANVLHPWCHPYCHRAPRSCNLSHTGVMKYQVTTQAVILLRGNHPPAPTCPSSNGRTFFGRPLTKAFQVAYPFRTFTMHRIAVGRSPCTLFAQRGSDGTINVVLFQLYQQISEMSSSSSLSPGLWSVPEIQDLQ